MSTRPRQAGPERPPPRRAPRRDRARPAPSRRRTPRRPASDVTLVAQPAAQRLPGEPVLERVAARSPASNGSRRQLPDDEHRQRGRAAPCTHHGPGHAPRQPCAQAGQAEHAAAPPARPPGCAQPRWRCMRGSRPRRGAAARPRTPRSPARRRRDRPAPTTTGRAARPGPRAPVRRHADQPQAQPRCWAQVSGRHALSLPPRQGERGPRATAPRTSAAWCPARCGTPPGSRRRRSTAR